MKQLTKYQEIKILANPYRWKIINLLKEKEMYLKEIAASLNISPEAAHYHLKLLKPFLNIRKEKTKNNLYKIYYSLKYNSFIIGEVKPSILPSNSFFTSKTVKIIVGSPDPHGKYEVRARDAYLSAYVAHYLGKYNHNIEVIWDTEAKSLDLHKDNVIVLGGPISNVIAELINKQAPLKFDEKTGYRTFIHKKKKIAAEDHMGLVYCMSNPFNTTNKLVWLAGTTLQGTYASVLAYIKEKIKCPGAYIIEGLDKNSDGKIDTTTIFLSSTV